MKNEGRTLREEREQGEKRCYFISLWQKRKQTLILAPRLSEGSRADFATWLLLDVHGHKSIGQPRLEQGC